jgi:toxin ParE1/3/4
MPALRLLRSQDYQNDVDGIIEHISLRGGSAAQDFVAEVEKQVARLRDFPLSGRVGRLGGTRELVIQRTPYIVVYSTNGIVILMRILHGARRWPPSRPASLR